MEFPDCDPGLPRGREGQSASRNGIRADPPLIEYREKLHLIEFSEKRVDKFLFKGRIVFCGDFVRISGPLG